MTALRRALILGLSCLFLAWSSAAAPAAFGLSDVLPVATAYEQAEGSPPQTLDATNIAENGASSALRDVTIHHAPTASGPRPTYAYDSVARSCHKAWRGSCPSLVGLGRSVEPAEADQSRHERFGVAAKSVRQGPLNPGPFSDDVANTFRGGSYSAVTSNKSTTVYRVYSSNRELGPYWTRTKPSGPVQSIIDSALDPAWGNRATKWAEARVPAGTTFYEGAAASQRGLVGGGSQVFIPRVESSWVVGRGGF